MKAIIRILTAFVFALIFGSFTYSNTATYSLTIEVKNLRNSIGIVQFALYNKDGSIPDEKYEQYFSLLTGEIVNGSSGITFKDIPPGTYAVNILHDENKNGKIDKGLLFPKEGIGFSNFLSIGLTNKPNFSKASFDVKENKTIHVKMIYF